MNYNLLDELEHTINRDYGNITGIVVIKNGKPLYENYFNDYSGDDALHVYSVTKSIFSALFGIAIDKGHIKSVEQKVLDFFPNYTVVEDEAKIRQISIRDMMTMTVPYKYEEEPYEAFFMSSDWTRFAFDLLGGKGCIGDFQYSAIIGTHILSAVLAKATGRSILDFATENLFSPLGINVPGNVLLRTKEEHIAAMNGKSTKGWAVDPQGINPAGWGLFLTPMEMAKIGQLYLDRGVCNNRQLVPMEWIADSTKAHSHWGELSYGYLWWIIDEKEGSYAAMGDGGNVIYVNPQKHMVISIASLFVPDAKDRIGLIREYIEPIIES